MIKFFKEEINSFKRDALVLGKILVPLGFVIAMAFYYQEFVRNAILANVVINSGIIITAMYGVILILTRLSSAMEDFRVIERFDKEALKGADMSELLEEPWLKRRYVKHYLYHIAQTGGTISSQLDQNAIESELHALQGEYESKLELPQFLVGFMIAMGLLGTFIGLLTTLTGIAGMLDSLGSQSGDVDIQQKFVDLVTELRKPLAGMGIAFSASMFGLITSLMLAIMMTNLRRYVNRVVALARNTMHDLIELKRPVVTTEIERRRSDLGDGTGIGVANGDIVVSRIDLLIKKMELLMQSFQDSIDATQKTNALLGFGPRMQEIGERTLEEIKMMTLANGEQRSLMQKQIDVNGEMARLFGKLLDVQLHAKEVGDTVSENIRGTALVQSEQNKLVQKLIDISSTIPELLNTNILVQRQTKEIGEKSFDSLNALVSGQQVQGKLSQKFVEAQSVAVRTAESTLDQQVQLGTAHDSSKLIFAEMVSVLKGMVEHLIKVEEIDLGGARHLASIKEVLTKLCQSFGVVDLLATGAGQQTLLLERLVNEAAASQNLLYAIQQRLSRDTK